MIEINSFEAESITDLRLMWREYRMRFNKEIARDKHVVLRSVKTNTCIEYPSGAWSLRDYVVLSE